MPRISVVVPVYNVEQYLRDCLESLAAQTFEDIQVVMVDDGSTDGSAAIAQSFADRDPRFTLVSQANGGLSAARNTGIESATGEFLAFVDSDDVVAPNAYELLVGTLDRTGSDFASGNAHRLYPTRTRQVGFLARPFAKTRLKTHITRQRTLLTDRTAWNKLWRRAFWDEHGLRFPEGRTYEDIPVVIPLHFAARSVDVLSDVIYYWRTREGENLSITQRRNHPQELDNRLLAIQDVSRYLAEHGPRKAKRWYDATVVEQDLKYFLNALDTADDDYRAYFIERVNAYLRGVSPRVFRRLPAIDRLKWHFVQRGMLPELLEIRRYEQEEMDDALPVKIGGHWYLDHPFRTDRRLHIRRSLFRVDRDLDFTPWIDTLRWEDGGLRIEGGGSVAGIGAPRPDSQRVTVVALQPGRLQQVRQRVAGVRVRARNVQPDEQAPRGDGLADATWAGFVATLAPGRLRSLGRWQDGTWDVYVAVKVGKVRRYRSRFHVDSARPLRAAHHLVPGGPQIAVEPSPLDQIALQVRSRWASVSGHRLDGDEIELHGELGGAEAAGLELELARRDDRHRYPLAVAAGRPHARFTARVPLADVLEGDREDAWELSIVGRRVTLAPEAAAVVAAAGGEELALARSLDGHASLSVRPASATVERAGPRTARSSSPARSAPPEPATSSSSSAARPCAATRSRCARTGPPDSSAPG